MRWGIHAFCGIPFYPSSTMIFSCNGAGKEFRSFAMLEVIRTGRENARLFQGNIKILSWLIKMTHPKPASSEFHNGILTKLITINNIFSPRVANKMTRSKTEELNLKKEKFRIVSNIKEENMLKRFSWMTVRKNVDTAIPFVIRETSASNRKTKIRIYFSRR